MQNIQFWKDKSNNIPNAILFSKIAEEHAEAISKDRRCNKYSQLRKFYDEVTRINTLSASTSWEHILPMVHMLGAKAAYAMGRKLVSEDFLNDIKTCINQVNDLSDLKIFTNYFEAFMGYYKYFRPKDK